jgi:hypothetical protein
MSGEALRALERIIEKEAPFFQIRFKDESYLMRALGLLMRPFNPTFLTNFTTTVGAVVYFPSRARYEAEPNESIATLSHEFVHIHDSRETGPRFQLGYAAPQVWAVPLLLIFSVLGNVLPLCLLLAGYVALAATCAKKPTIFWSLFAAVVIVVLGVSIVKAGWWTLVLLGALACLGPWSSPGRTHWEVRGYTMNNAIYMWVRNALVPEKVVSHYEENFTGPDYWFMCRDAEKVEALFTAAIRMVLERRLQREKPYSVIHGFLLEQGRVSLAFKD